MRLPAFLVVLLTGLMAASLVSAETPEPTFGPTPDWVTPVDPAPPASNDDNANGGIVYLLVDTQTYVTPQTDEMYYRKVMQTTSIEGVETASDLSITFDPTWTKVVLHHMRVLRGDQVIDKTHEAVIDMARRERELDKRVYNGDWTALVRLADVRPGDTVDVAWSWIGRNPVFGRNAFFQNAMGWSIQVNRRHVSTSWPTRMLKRWQALDAPVDAKIETDGDRTTISYGPFTTKAVDPENGTPSWVQQYPYMATTSFANWQDVADWATPLYQIATDNNVRKIANTIREKHTDKNEQLLAALRFAQEQVRYLSITMGEGGYVPRPPATTLANRFGDCKDKTILFILLARELGFDAVPALTNLGNGPGLADRLPSPGAFNHVITRVMVDGKPYWLDATDRGQRGPLEQFTQANTGYALPLEANPPGLVAIPDPEPAQVLETIKETIDISHGTNAPMTLAVVSEFRGARADTVRARVAAYGTKGMKDQYLDFYRQYFPDIRYEENMQIEDDPEHNIMRIEEKLISDKPWTVSSDGDAYELNYSMYATTELVDTSATPNRKLPLAVNDGVHARHETVVLLTDNGKDWDLPAESKKLDNAAFGFTYDASKRRGQWTQVAEIHSKRRAVPPSEASKVLADNHDVHDIVRWGLQVTK